jgi:hypothetical protein
MALGSQNVQEPPSAAQKSGGQDAWDFRYDLEMAHFFPVQIHIGV